jgi:hypothetical protein
MHICKNAKEYWEELWKLRGEAWREFFDKVTKIRAEFHTIEDPTTQDFENIEKAERILWADCFKEANDFDNRQPVKPLFVFKKNRKWHELRFVVGNPDTILWISPEPVDEQTMREKSNAWILPINFNDKVVDVAICRHCKKEFIRYKPHQQNCDTCKRSLKNIGFNPYTDLDKHRYCLNCGKHLPNGKHGKAKYCCGACRTAACKKRKSVIIFPLSSGER